MQRLIIDTSAWGITENSVFLKIVTNKYDGETVNLENIILFGIELDGGKQLTNLDFKMKAPHRELNLEASDTVPTKAVLFPAGKFPFQWLQKIKT